MFSNTLTSMMAAISRDLNQAKAEADQAKEQSGQNDLPVIQEIRADPTLVMRRAKMMPEQWQAQFLHSQAKRIILLMSRQVGKSQATAAKALWTALVKPNNVVLLISASLRQSGVLFRDRLLPLWRALGMPLFLKRPTQLAIELSNGSRIVCLPATPDTIVGDTVDLLVIDEAARVPDSLYDDVLPMLLVRNGTLVLLSTPKGKRGFFYHEWQEGEGFERYKITCYDCPRIFTPTKIAQAKKRGDRYFNQNMGCSFLDNVGQLLPQSEIDAMFSSEVEPLFQSLR